jgi:hypothetical protein
MPWRLIRCACALGENLPENRLDALFHAQSRRIDHDSFAVPRSVIPLNDLLPGWHCVTNDVRCTRFHAAPVFARIRADDLDVDCRYTASFCDGSPLPPGKGPWVDTVRDDDAAEAEVVFSDRVRDVISLVLDRPSGPAQGLLDRVDAQIDAAKSRATWRAIVVFPAPGRPLRAMSITASLN